MINTLEDRVRLRATIVGIVILTMIGVLIARLWFLQVLAGEEFAAKAESNSVRIVSIEAPRGRILDRRGRVLVKNRPALAIGIRKDDLPDDEAEALEVKRRLARLLGITVRDINRTLADKRVSPYKAAVIASDVSEESLFEVKERRDLYPGVETLTLPVRTYPLGSLAAHILGYVGETTEEEIKTLDAYRLGDRIGRTGVERTYEQWLRGEPGLQKLEVDATGRVLRERLLGSRPAQPGSDVYLSLDARLQRIAEGALTEGIERARGQTFHSTGESFKAPAAATVVLDARTGEIVAMASFPTFDIRQFVGGVTDRYWSFLNDERNRYPLLNRAIQSSYPPGSTYKPVLATAALATGAASPGGGYPCKTQFRFGDTVFRNWQPRDATISLAQSIIESCDTVYYNFARNWWLREQSQIAAGKKPSETMQSWSRRFGLGAKTGIDLPQETAGRIPDRSWRRQTWEANKDSYCKTYRRTRSALFEDLCERGFLWRGGDAVNMSIGQGDVLATPLQMAVAYAAIANGGKVLQPHVGLKVVSPAGDTVEEIETTVVRRIKAPGDDIKYVQRALRQVPERGTAQFPFRGWPFDEIPMAAKTGSSEIAGKQPYSWFAAYGPANDPRYVAVAVVEEAGFGSQVAGPIVRRLFDELFDQPPLPIVYGTSRSD
ncbi:MAG TPA: penicillin-binding protein 2 [Actinomycetota bacterium]